MDVIEKRGGSSCSDQQVYARPGMQGSEGNSAVPYHPLPGDGIVLGRGLWLTIDTDPHTSIKLHSKVRTSYGCLASLIWRYTKLVYGYVIHRQAGNHTPFIPSVTFIRCSPPEFIK
jgi:hypothetical protein